MQKTQLVAASQYVFVALDKRMKIMVDNPEVTDSSAIHATVLVTMPLLSDAASGKEMTTLVARR